MSTALAPRCRVCKLNMTLYTEHWRLHWTIETIYGDRTVEVERANLWLRDSLGLPPGGGADRFPWPTVPATLPGVGGAR